MMRHLRALAVLGFGFWALVLGTPGLDGLSGKALTKEEKRAELRTSLYGRAKLFFVDLNRDVRKPMVVWLTPLQRPLRIAQSWGLYGGGPNRVRKLEIYVDGELKHRSNDPAHPWLNPVLRFRKVRPIGVTVCQDNSKNTQPFMDYVVKRAHADFPDATGLEVRCTLERWPNDPANDGEIKTTFSKKRWLRRP